MPNGTYSHANVKHDGKITREEFFDKFSIDGKNVSVPMMVFGDKKIAEDFTGFFKHFKFPEFKYCKGEDKLVRTFLEPCYGSGHEAREEALKIMEPFFEAALVNEGFSLATVVGDVDEKFFSTIPSIFTMAFNSKFGHSLSDTHKMVKLMDGYDTNCDVLGTKGEFELEDFYVDGDEFTFRTETAGCTPDKFFQGISKEFNTKVVATSTNEDSIGMTHECGGTDEDDEDFDDEKYDEVHGENPDLCFEHMRGLGFENGKEKYDVILDSREEEEDFGTSDYKLGVKGGE